MPSKNKTPSPDYERLLEARAAEQAREQARYKAQRKYMDTGEKLLDDNTGGQPYNPPATRGVQDLNRRSGADRQFFLKKRNEEEAED